MSNRETLLRAWIPITSLWQIADRVGSKLDTYIVEAVGVPYRSSTTEVEKPPDLPFCIFRRSIRIQAELHYSLSKFDIPFETMKIIEKFIEHGIDDCKLQRLDFKIPKKNKVFTFSFRTKPAKESSEIGRLVVKLRENYLRKAGKEEKKKEARQLELTRVDVKEGKFKGRPLSIEEMTNEELLRWLRRKTYGLVMMKRVLPMAKTIFRDLNIVDGVMFEGETSLKSS